VTADLFQQADTDTMLAVMSEPKKVRDAALMTVSG
jgi:hypothetical protein